MVVVLTIMVCLLPLEIDQLIIADVSLNMASDTGDNLPVQQTIAALAMSFAICMTAAYLTKLYGIQGGTLPVITAIVVILATVLARQFGYLAEAGDTISLVLMQVLRTPYHNVSFFFSFFDLKRTRNGVDQTQNYNLN